MDKRRMGTTVKTTCSRCGHEGELYLDGDRLRDFHTSVMEWWWAVSGWKMWLAVFAMASIAGFMFGKWRP